MYQVYGSFVLVILLALSTLAFTGCGPGQDAAVASTPAPTGLQWLISVLTPAPKNTIASLDSLAQQFVVEGKPALAERHAQQALRLREVAWGSEHPHVASGLEHLAGIYSAQGKYAEAGPLLHNALAIREKALGAEHPEVAASLERYAGLLRHLQREPEAQLLESRAQAIRAQGERTTRPRG